MAEDIMYPGDSLAEEEEFLPGRGTYCENGKIYAANIGEVDIDPDKREIRIKGRIQVSRPMHKGLTVIGMVARSRDKSAFVDLFPLEKDKIRYFPLDASTVLKVTEVKRSFVKSLNDEVKAGDFIRAKIIQATDTDVLLTIKEDHLGVIKAFCSRCRAPLVLKGNDLVCNSCKSKEHRKTADDYGQGKVE